MMYFTLCFALFASSTVSASGYYGPFGYYGYYDLGYYHNMTEICSDECGADACNTCDSAANACSSTPTSCDDLDTMLAPGGCAENCDTCTADFNSFLLGCGEPFEPIDCGEHVGNTIAFASSLLGNPSPEHIYSFVAPETNNYTFTTCTDDFEYDTMLRAYNGTSPMTGAQLTTNDDWCGAQGLQSAMFLELQEGQQITVVVEGYYNNAGSYNLRVCCGYDDPLCDDISKPHEGGGYYGYYGYSGYSWNCEQLQQAMGYFFSYYGAEQHFCSDFLSHLVHNGHATLGNWLDLCSEEGFGGAGGSQCQEIWDDYFASHDTDQSDTLNLNEAQAFCEALPTEWGLPTEGYYYSGYYSGYYSSPYIPMWARNLTEGENGTMYTTQYSSTAWWLDCDIEAYLAEYTSATYFEDHEMHNDEYVEDTSGETDLNDAVDDTSGETDLNDAVDAVENSAIAQTLYVAFGIMLTQVSI